jgi:hypothetical protein
MPRTAFQSPRFIAVTVKFMPLQPTLTLSGRRYKAFLN